MPGGKRMGPYTDIKLKTYKTKTAASALDPNVLPLGFMVRDE